MWSEFPPVSHTCHIFVIRTNHYAGNFEREMCAYMTGQVGECGVGEGIAEEQFGHPEQSPWFEKLDMVPDDHGCRRPVSMMDENNTSVGLVFYEKPTGEEIEELKARAHAFCEFAKTHERFFDSYKEEPIVIDGFEWRTYEVNVEVTTQEL